MFSDRSTVAEGESMLSEGFCQVTIEILLLSGCLCAVITMKYFELIALSTRDIGNLSRSFSKACKTEWCKTGKGEKWGWNHLETQQSRQGSDNNKSFTSLFYMTTLLTTINMSSVRYLIQAEYAALEWPNSTLSNIKQIYLYNWPVQYINKSLHEERLIFS